MDQVLAHRFQLVEPDARHDVLPDDDGRDEGSRVRHARRAARIGTFSKPQSVNINSHCPDIRQRRCEARSEFVWVGRMGGGLSREGGGWVLHNNNNDDDTNKTP